MRSINKPLYEKNEPVQNCNTAIWDAGFNSFFSNHAFRGSPYGESVCSSLTLTGHLDLRTEPVAAKVDKYSLQCMGCHNDRASNNSGGLMHGSGSTNHSIGVNYDTAFQYGGYQPRFSLSDSIFLPDNQVSCVSCHNAYSKDHGLVVGRREGSDLCYSCHDIQEIPGISRSKCSWLR